MSLDASHHFYVLAILPNIIIMSATELAVGVDLGTTNCCVAHLDEHGVVEIIADPQGDKIIPSHVAKTEDGYLVGKLAKEEHPAYAVYDSKRLIGRTFDDPCIQNNLKSWPFKVKSQDNLPLMEVELSSPVKSEKNFVKPEEISAELLRHMKQIAEEYFGREVKNAVVTVPAHFGYHQRMATKEAAKLAGLNVLGMINEPSAAALGYIHKHKIRGEKHLLVFDLGGGTFDISIVKVNSAQVSIIATAGNTYLGGRDFDRNLANFIGKKLTTRYGVDVLPQLAQRRILAGAENLKIRLSRAESAVLDLPQVWEGLDVELRISRSEFEEVNLGLFKATMDTLENCLLDAQLSKSQIDEVVLVGGATKTPRIQSMLKEFFGKPLSKAINPDEAVAYGASVQTAKFGGKKEVAKVADVTPLSLGIRTGYDTMFVCVRRNTAVPVHHFESFLTSLDKQRQVHLNIFEGERALTSQNVLLGTCTLELPPQPPGYRFDVIFEIDDDGILHVSAREESGRHTHLLLQYSPPRSSRVDDAIKDAQVNKQEDRLKAAVLDRFNFLKMYLVKLRAVCDYDNRHMLGSDKDEILRRVEEVDSWISVNEISAAPLEKEREIVGKIDLLDAKCQPILRKYGYNIRDTYLEAFNKMIKDMQACKVSKVTKSNKQ